MVIANPAHWKQPFNDKGPKYDKIAEMIADINSNASAISSHASSSGSSHTYINQSVTTGASPSFVNLTLTGSTLTASSHLILKAGSSSYVDVRPLLSTYGLIVRENADTSDYVNLGADSVAGYLTYIGVHSGSFSVKFNNVGTIILPDLGRWFAQVGTYDWGLYIDGTNNYTLLYGYSAVELRTRNQRVCFIDTSNRFLPNTHYTTAGIGIGSSGQAFDECYADNWNNVTAWRTFLNPKQMIMNIKSKANPKMRIIGGQTIDEEKPDYATLPDWVRERDVDYRTVTKQRPLYDKYGDPEKDELGAPMFQSYEEDEAFESVHLEDSVSINRMQVVLIQALQEVVYDMQALESRIQALEAA